jgi:hypothetical protein
MILKAFPLNHHISHFPRNHGFRCICGRNDQVPRWWGSNRFRWCVSWDRQMAFDFCLLYWSLSWKLYEIGKSYVKISGRRRRVSPFDLFEALESVRSGFWFLFTQTAFMAWIMYVLSDNIETDKMFLPFRAETISFAFHQRSILSRFRANLWHGLLLFSIISKHVRKVLNPVYCIDQWELMKIWINDLNQNMKLSKKLLKKHHSVRHPFIFE